MARATKNSISGGPLRSEPQMTGLRRGHNQASLGATRSKRFRFDRQARIGEVIADRAESASRWPMRTLSEGPNLGVFPQMYHE
jgi:hypothetical protein